MNTTLEHLTQQARNAYNWTSFDPEKRGDRTIQEFTTLLNEDLLTLEKLGATTEQLERYKQRFENHFSSWLGSMSNCASSFITGGSNFPVERMRKRNQWADNKYSQLIEFRQKVIGAYEKYARKAKKEALEDQHGGASGVARLKLANLERRQEHMKTVNTLHKEYLKNPNGFINDNPNLSADILQVITSYVARYSWEPHPYAPYQLTNNGAEIRRMKSRVDELETKEVLKNTAENNDLTFTGGKIVLNYEIDRIQLIYDSKPEYETIKALKHRGFHWSPANKAWQRQLNNNGKYAAECITGIKF